MTRWTSADSVTGWTWMRDFWQNCNPASTNYEFMQEPLARGEVLVAWDHVARLVAAPQENPDDWVMVPSPTGPKGLGYMLILAGMAIPRGGNREQAEKVITALSTPEAQVEVLRQNAFFPVVDAPLPTDLPAPIKLEAEAVTRQQEAPGALLALPPVGLGAKDGEFGQVFKDVFREICLQDGDPQTVVSRYATNLQSVLDAATQATAVAPAQGRSRRVSPAFWLILPSIIFMVFLFAYPMVEGIRAAFIDGDAGGFTTTNWSRMVSDPLFWPAGDPADLPPAVLDPAA